jgi:hypothetical protein
VRNRKVNPARPQGPRVASRSQGALCERDLRVIMVLVPQGSSPSKPENAQQCGNTLRASRWHCACTNTRVRGKHARTHAFARASAVTRTRAHAPTRKPGIPGTHARTQTRAPRRGRHRLQDRVHVPTGSAARRCVSLSLCLCVCACAWLPCPRVITISYHVNPARLHAIPCRSSAANPG